MTKLTPDDEVMYRFLLDQLSAAEREALELRMFRDADFFQLVEATEDELVMRYVRGDLGEPWRGWFESEYFKTDVRRSRVEQARALSAASAGFAEKPVATVAAKVAVVGGLIAASAVVGVGVYRAVDAGKQEVAVLRLKPGQARGPSGRMPASAAGSAVRIELELPAGETGGEYLAVLSTPENPGGLWSVVVEAGPGALAALDVPASKLGGGEYILELRRRDRKVASYQFRMHGK